MSLPPPAGPVLVDTNVVSYLFRESPLGEPYRVLLAGRAALVSFQTTAELLVWPLKNAWGERRRARLEAFLAAFAEVPPTPRISRRWAEVTVGASLAGRPIQTADAWIAASALELGVPLVTHNASDFAGVPGLELLVARP